MPLSILYEAERARKLEACTLVVELCRQFFSSKLHPFLSITLKYFYVENGPLINLHMSPEEREVHQPIHPDIRPKLDPEYVAFHDKYMQYVPRDESKDWDGTARTAPSLPFGGAETVEVASIQDIELPNFKLRAYSPEAHHASNLPCLLWFHGGGWAIGGVEDGKDFCSFVCRGELHWESGQLSLAGYVLIVTAC